MNYNEAMEYLDNAAMFGMNFGLERTINILKHLGNPQDKIKCIHIAGTNGKGSTTAMISSVLRESGYKVGMHTSPYIEVFEERIQINNKNIPKERLAEIITKVRAAVDLLDTAKIGVPTYFELVSCAAFLYFCEEKVDFAVIEVGLGGRLDSTNVMVPELSIITSISYDHMNILGNTLGEIAGEKAGIIKENVPVIAYPNDDEVMEVIKNKCEEMVSELIIADKIGELVKIIKGENTIPYQIACIDTVKNKYELKLPLLGEHQIKNATVAICALEKLSEVGYEITLKSILNGINKVTWPGRLEVLKESPMVVIDGAHNLGGIKALAENTKKYFSYNNMVLILGILADKQVEEMIKTIVPMASKVITVTPNNNRAESNVELMDIIKKYNENCEAIDNYEEAYKKGLSYCSEDDLLLISGSLYMIGDMRKIIN